MAICRKNNFSMCRAILPPSSSNRVKLWGTDFKGGSYHRASTAVETDFEKQKPCVR